MSRHRELKDAQAEVNRDVAALVDHLELKDISDPNAKSSLYLMRLLANSWRDFERLRNQFDGDAPASARDTSINAAKANPPRKGSMRRDIVIAIVGSFSQFQTGMTCKQIEGRLRKPHESVSPAVNAMETGGWIEDRKIRRNTPSGQPAIVWFPTDKAIRWVTEEVGL